MDSRDLALPQPADATSSVAWSASDPSLLASSGWDGTVKLFDAATGTVRATLPHTGAVLDVAFPGAQGSAGKLYSGGLDRNIRELDVATSQQTLLGAHADTVRCVKWCDEAGCLLSGSWDRTMRLTDARAGPNAKPLWADLPAPVYSMDAVGNRIVVAMGKRHIWIFDPRKVVEPTQKTLSHLKFMTRACRISPDGSAYVVTSIEGRVAVELFDQSEEAQKRTYAFKTARATVDGVETLHPVNAVAFHPNGTFATGGGDAIVSVWDLRAKKRLKQLPKYPGSISALAFSPDGTRLAIAASVLEEEGTASGAQNGLVVRTVGDEVKPKSK